MSIYYNGRPVRIVSVTGAERRLSVAANDRPAIELEMTNGLYASDLIADGGTQEIEYQINEIVEFTRQILGDLAEEMMVAGMTSPAIEKMARRRDS